MLITLHDTPALKLHPADDVAIALTPLGANKRIDIAGQAVRLADDIAAGHKLALRPIEPGQPIRRYGQVIGFATRPIEVGRHVHSHNLAVGEMHLLVRAEPIGAEHLVLGRAVDGEGAAAVIEAHDPLGLDVGQLAGGDPVGHRQAPVPLVSFAFEASALAFMRAFFAS